MSPRHPASRRPVARARPQDWTIVHHTLGLEVNTEGHSALDQASLVNDKLVHMFGANAPKRFLAAVDDDGGGAQANMSTQLREVFGFDQCVPGCPLPDLPAACPVSPSLHPLLPPPAAHSAPHPG